MQKPENYIGHHESEQVDAQKIDRFNMEDPETPDDWVAIARDAYSNSTDYFDANIRKQIEKNLALFQSKHPQGSKYHTDSYKYRSKVFRPKVRAMTRRHEAAAAMAFFGTTDIVSCEPENSDDPDSVIGSKLSKNWLDYRLKNSINWFKLLIGGYQDAMTTGVVISRQEWRYEEENYEVDEHIFGTDNLAVLDENNVPLISTVTKTRPVVDKPDISLVPIENFRFSTGADWTDPVKTSPFLVEIIPMFVGDLKQKMKKSVVKPTDDQEENLSIEDPEQLDEGILDLPENQNKTGDQKEWYELSDGEILSALTTGDYDTTRMVRLGKRMDPLDESYELSLFDIVWVHRNIIKQDGEDMIFYTLGTEFLLSDPVPLTDVFKHGRPYVMGHCVIESHKNYPSGLPELAQDLVTETNDLANQRLDNIKLILNKRYKAVRGRNTDWKALTNSIPGGVILVDDLRDIEEESFSDVTGSAYQEQDRINVDFDELVGSFSVGSVQTNRSLNETVGGMSMALDDSNIITEYQLRVFTETWIEPVLQQVLDMGKYYETDEEVLKIIGKELTPEVTSELMDHEHKVNIVVGFGASSPQKKIERIATGIKAISEIAPGIINELNSGEIAKEIFGAMGYRDGARFLVKKAGENVPEDPRVAQMQRQIDELSAMIKTDQYKLENQLKIAQIKEQGNTQREEMKLKMQQELTNLEIRIKYIKEQVAAEKNDIARGELILQQEALEFKKRERETELLTNERNRLSEVLMNDQYGIVPAAEG